MGRACASFTPPSISSVPGTLGGSTHVQAVAEGLAALGHEVHVAVSRGPVVCQRVAASASRDSGGRVHWHAIGTPFGRRSFGWCRRGALRALAMTLRPDVVIERYHNFGGEGLLAARACGARTCSR